LQEKDAKPYGSLKMTITEEQNWKIEKGEIVILQNQLDVGGWGQVLEGIFRGSKVAIKTLYKEIVSSYNVDLFIREIKINVRCCHINIVQFLAATTERTPLIVMEIKHTDL